MANKSRKIIEYHDPIDYANMAEIIGSFAEKYDFISINNLGKSIFGRSIPIIKLGNGEKKVIYIGAHHGSEWITTGLLLRFINEYCELYKSSGTVEGISIGKLFESVEISVIPMLNPDGVEFSVNGITEDNILFSRLVSMNKESRDFTHWQANGRGVDLNHNYNLGFGEYKIIEAEQGITGGAPTKFSGEYPESEPETGYLCNYIRFYGDFKGALTLHSQGEEIYYTSGGRCLDGCERIASYLSDISGYTYEIPTGSASYGGFTDWFIDEFKRPAITLECGKGQNPLPLANLPLIYIRIRRVLFELPLIFCRFRLQRD